MPTLRTPLEPAATGAPRAPTQAARLALALLALAIASTAIGQSACLASWDAYEQDRARWGTTPWNDPADPAFHTQIHLSHFNAQLAVENRMSTHFGIFQMAMYNTFGFDLKYLADQAGMKSVDELLMARGLSALDPFVDFDAPIEIGHDGSSDLCAALYPVTDGSHEGEFLLIVKKGGLVRHFEVVPTEDVGRARAHEVLEALEEGVMLDPDGCGDARVGEECGPPPRR